MDFKNKIYIIYPNERVLKEISDIFGEFDS